MARHDGGTPVAEPISHQCGKVAIDFAGNDLSSGIEECFGERPGSWSDLEDAAVGTGQPCP